MKRLLYIGGFAWTNFTLLFIVGVNLFQPFLWFVFSLLFGVCIVNYYIEEDKNDRN
jgi:hypothetical protein